MHGALRDELRPDGLPRQSLLDRLASGGVEAHRQALAGRAAGYGVEADSGSWAVTVDPLRDAGGAVVGCVGVAVDASAEGRRQLELAEAREALRALAENVPLVVYTASLDEEPGPRFVSSAIEELVGIPAHAFTFHDLRDAIHPDDRDGAVAAIEAADRTGADLRIEYRIVRPDGTVRWVEDASRVILVGGELLAQGYLLDITERKENEEQLERRARTRRLLADIARRSVAGSTVRETLDAVLDLLHTGIDADAAAFLEWRGGEVVVAAGFGWEPAGAVAGAGSPARQVAETGTPLVSGDVNPAPGSLRARTGIRSSLVAPVAIGYEVLGVLAVHARRRDAFGANDLSLVEHAGSLVGAALSRARAEEQRRAMEAQLVHAQRLEAVGQLAAGVAHDFNNLLTAINGYTELAKQTTSDPRVAGYLDEALTAGDRARELIAQLLAFSRKQRLEPQRVRPAELVRRLEPMLVAVLGRALELELQLHHDAEVAVDVAQLENVLMNLAANARDASAGGGTLTVTTGTRAVAPDEAADHEVAPGAYATIAVADTGSGIAPEVLGRIFEPFFTTKPTGGGTGLGLAGVYGVMRQSGGFVEVRSEVGVGTEFVLALPVAD